MAGRSPSRNEHAGYGNKCLVAGDLGVARPPFDAPQRHAGAVNLERIQLVKLPRWPDLYSPRIHQVTHVVAANPCFLRERRRYH